MVSSHSDTKLSKSGQTKHRITESFLALIQTKCWDKISVKEVCANANITRTTFYQYYEDIFDVMEKIQEKHLSALKKLSENCLPVSTPSHITSMEEFQSRFDTPSELFRIWYTYCSEHKLDFLALCHSSNGDEYFKKKLHTLCCYYLDISMDLDGFPRDGYRRHFLDLVFNTFFESMYSWLSTDNGDILSIDQLCSIVSAWRIGSAYQHLSEAEQNKTELTRTPAS